MTFGTLSTGTQAKRSLQLLTSRGRPTKFTLERIQQIRNLVERGESREQIAEMLDVTVGSLQVTCSRLGISLRRPKVAMGSACSPAVATDRTTISSKLTVETDGARPSREAAARPVANA